MDRQLPQTKLFKKIISLVAVSVFGLASWVLPGLVINHLSADNPTIALFEEKNEISSLVVYMLFILTGIFAGYKFPSVKPWMFGIAGVILLPLYTFYEISKYPYSHNLWPIEFALTYPYFAIIIIGSAFMGRLLYKKRNKEI